MQRSEETTTEATNQYIVALEGLWDMLSDAIEGGRLTEADVPDDYQALVAQMTMCEQAKESTNAAGKNDAR